MASWAEFRQGDPVLAALAEARMAEDGLVLVGTLRANGWPRISPVEPLVVGDELYLGMMWQSRKAHDLLADARCVVHTTVHDTAGTQGDVKVYGRADVVTDPDERDRYGAALEKAVGWHPEGDFHLFAVDVSDPDERQRYEVALEAAVGWRPVGEFHLFTLDLTEVGYFRVVDEGHDTRVWRP